MKTGTICGKCEYWRAMQVRIPEIVRGHKEGEPFPSIDALRPSR